MNFYSKGGGWRKNQISHPEWSVNRETGQMRNRPLMTIAVSWFFARWHFPLPDRVLTWLQMILLQIVGFPERLNPIKEDFAAGLLEGAMFLRERFPGRWVLIFSGSGIWWPHTQSNTGRLVGVWRPREALVWRCPCFLQVREQIGRNILTYIGKWTNHYILSFFQKSFKSKF